AQKQGPTKHNDLERPASVGVKGAKVKLRHVKLSRDTYYTTGREDKPSAADVEFDADNPEKWGPLREDMPLATFFVQPNHFLCLGDTSPESSDGRTWGLVPRRLLLGRALLVYYPLTRAGRIR